MQQVLPFLPSLSNLKPKPSFSRLSSIKCMENIHRPMYLLNRVRLYEKHIFNLSWLIFQIDVSVIAQVKPENSGKRPKMVGCAKTGQRRQLKRTFSKEQQSCQPWKFGKSEERYLRRQFNKVPEPTSKQIAYLARQLSVEFHHVKRWFDAEFEKFIKSSMRPLKQFDILDSGILPPDNGGVDSEDGPCNGPYNIVVNNADSDEEQNVYVLETEIPVSDF